jgi:hypothetical protein
MRIPGRALGRSAACLLVLVFGQRAAHAEPTRETNDRSETSRADSLFREGRALFSAGRMSEACKKFEESQALDPSPGTLLNLGACHREQGDLLRSMADFRLAIELASTHPDETRRAAWSEAAEKELQALEPRIPTLKVRSTTSGQISVSLDGALLAEPFPPSGTLVNPGRHRVEARAPGRVPWGLDVRVVEAQVLEIVVPELSAAPSAATPSAAGAEPGVSSQNVAPYVAFGISGALLGGGVVTGLLARSAESELEEQCTEPDPARSGRVLCDPSLESTRDRARTLGVVTDVLWAGSLVSAGVGVFLLLNEPGNETKKVGRAAGRPATPKLGLNVDAGCSGAGCSMSVAGKF